MIVSFRLTKPFVSDNMDVIEEEVIEYKVYKEKPYLNSDRDPFGLTFKGKSKEYLKAHEKLKDIIKKGKQYVVKDIKMKVLNVNASKSMVIAIVEVSDGGTQKGNVEIKVHAASMGKKKGATLELRKMSGFEYLYVQKIRNVIATLLDGFISGEELESILESSENSINKSVSRVTSKCKLFACDLCNFETKFGSALKAHKTRIHKEVPTMNLIRCDVCESNFKSKSLLEMHKLEHKTGEKRSQESISPSSSPPRKRHELPKIDDAIEGEVEMMDVEIEANDLVNRLLERRIKELEKVIEDQRKLNEKEQTKLMQQIENLMIVESSMNKIDIPKHLSSVRKEHLKNLRGYRMRYKTVPNGACLENSFAVHAYENEEEGVKVKKRLNNHVADHWPYYKHRIALPYVERVGVGKNSEIITKTTEAEMIDFLRGDESLMVYSNSQELLAIANMFNVTINIFTYGGNGERWSQVKPDPEFVADAEMKFGKWIPDMALYHSDDTHYDLLVKDDSRLALLGILAGADEEGEDVALKDMEGGLNDWQKVEKKNRGMKEKNVMDEELLSEDVIIDDSMNDLAEERVLIKNKNSGNTRTSPQEDSEKVPNTKALFPCKKCNAQLESEGLLLAHANSHEEVNTNLVCNICDSNFASGSELKSHTEQKHEDNKPEQWNCNDCSFQASCASELMNHLKIMGHLPSKAEEDNRKTFKDFKQCFTCRKEFDGYWNLMMHRKSMHPSNRKCRNFPGTCTHGNDCWYLHVEDMETDQSDSGQKDPEVFNCNMCDESFREKSIFMKHRKAKHTGSNQICDKFRNGQCDKSSDDCWYLHSAQPTTKARSQPDIQQQDFPQAANPFPPDQMSKMFWMMNNLVRKVEGMEKRFEDLMM